MGDQIRQADGSTGTVWLKWEVHKTKEMYNLTVDTAHTFYVGEGQWLVHNACGGSVKKFAGETADTILGKKAHSNLPNILGPNYDYKVKLPSGLKPDAVDWTNHIVVELKPNKPKAVQQGWRQIKKYIGELAEDGNIWTGVVWTYFKKK